MCLPELTRAKICRSGTMANTLASLRLQHSLLHSFHRRRSSARERDAVERTIGILRRRSSMLPNTCGVVGEAVGGVMQAHTSLPRACRCTGSDAVGGPWPAPHARSVLGHTPQSSSWGARRAVGGRVWPSHSLPPCGRAIAPTPAAAEQDSRLAAPPGRESHRDAR